MKVKERFATEKLFAEINKVKPFPFSELFKAQNIIEIMDEFYIMTHGERTLNNIGKNARLESLAVYISTMFSDKWEKIFTSVLNDFPLIESLIETTTERVTEKETTNSANDETTTGLVSAYNDDNFVNNNENKTTNKLTGETKTENGLTRERRLIENPTETLKNAINYLQNNVIYFIIFNDVNSVITLQIYD